MARKGALDVTKPVCSISKGENFYSLIGKVTTALKSEGLEAEADMFVGRAVLLPTYDEVLALSQEYVLINDGDPNEF